MITFDQQSSYALGQMLDGICLAISNPPEADHHNITYKYKYSYGDNVFAMFYVSNVEQPLFRVRTE